MRFSPDLEKEVGGPTTNGALTDISRDLSHSSSSLHGWCFLGWELWQKRGLAQQVLFLSGFQNPSEELMSQAKPSHSLGQGLLPTHGHGMQLEPTALLCVM